LPETITSRPAAEPHATAATPPVWRRWLSNRQQRAISVHTVASRKEKPVDDLSPGEFLRSVQFNPGAASVRFPNARRHLEGGLFISHSGADTEQIRRVIVPVVWDRFAPEGFFLQSRWSGGAGSYRQLVQAALHWSGSFLLVLSQASLGNEWVHAEVEWALERSRAVLVARLDESGWDALRHQVRLSEQLAITPSGIADYRVDERRGGTDLAAAFDALPMKYAHRLGHS
jgi:hypothetical protein